MAWGVPSRRDGAGREGARRAGARRAAAPERQELDQTPVHRGPLLDERKRPVPVKRSTKVGNDLRVDPTRVSGPIRVVLEPMLWLAFLSGVCWVLVALDPGVRDPAPGVLLYEYTLPLAIIVAAVLLVSTISALMWLPVSTTATRARTAFAGLGMLASGWLFAKLHPVDTQDLLGMSWLSIAVGVLLVAVCAVPWPTSPALVPRRTTGAERMAFLAVLLASAVVGWLAWEAAQVGLVAVPDGAETGWDAVFPLLGLLVVLLAVARFLLRRPDRTPQSEDPLAHLQPESQY